VAFSQGGTQYVVGTREFVCVSCTRLLPSSSFSHTCWAGVLVINVDLVHIAEGHCLLVDYISDNV
jgi:hypothetical protein